jgi:hypothetical protein
MSSRKSKLFVTQNNGFYHKIIEAIDGNEILKFQAASNFAKE